MIVYIFNENHRDAGKKMLTDLPAGISIFSESDCSSEGNAKVHIMSYHSLYFSLSACLFSR